MAFYNGSSAVLNGITGSGPALNTVDMITNLRNFLSNNGWTVSTVTPIGAGQANIIFSSAGTNGDENINVRLQQGTVSNSLSPLNVAVPGNRVRLTAGPFFDTGGQVLYNEVGQSGPACEITTDDLAGFNFWVYTDGLPNPTYVHLVTQVGGAYYSLFAGRMTRQIYSQAAKTAGAISVSSPGAPQTVTIALDRARPASWVAGKILFIQSQSVADNSSNGAGVTPQILPVEMVTVGDLTGLNANQVKFAASHNYAAGALLGQDPLPIGVVKNAEGTGETICMSYDCGTAVNTLGYTSPANQSAKLGVPAMASGGADINAILTNQGPDNYQGDQIIVGLFSFNSSSNKHFGFRHQVPLYGRVPPANNPMDELVLPSGDRWTVYSIGTSRVAVGKEN